MVSAERDSRVPYQFTTFILYNNFISNTMNIQEAIVNLQPGQVLLVKAIKTKDNAAPSAVGYQLEFAEKIRSTDTQGPGAVLAMLNADDTRFGSGARRAWVKTTMTQASAFFGVNLGDDANWAINSESGKEELVIGKLNPTMNGLRVRLQVNESLIPRNDYQRDNITRAAKRKGKDGDFIFSGGKHIFSNTDVTLCKEGVDPTHTYLSVDATPVAASEIVDETLGGMI